MRVYVGTYGKYNSGSLYGAWIDLDEHDQDTFLEACQELHSDEHDPEFMLQDVDSIPRELFSESGLNDDIWEFIGACSRIGQEAAGAGIYLGIPAGELVENYYGQFNGPDDFALDYADNAGLGGCDTGDWPMCHIDWRAAGESLVMDEFCEHNGHYFRRA